MEHKTLTVADRTAVMDDEFPFSALRVRAKTLQKVFIWTFGQGTIDDQADGSFLVVLDHVNNGFNKSRVCHLRCSDEKLTREKWFGLERENARLAAERAGGD